MIVTDVRDYLKQQGQASLRDMALYFNMDQDALRPVVEQWVTKGKARRLPTGSTCNTGCAACEPETIELFQWID